ncbi:Exostosin family protein [Tripterygium wilfordii]|uniref:Exostosin family protein n=1 Tax=Tripterygium wilfordii TaxID=458696 RepID=A0A7J7CP20_TRIWF|nr:probable xyloglucan galactosyltransferase GT17 [Tripterygium wilfordii]KAF5735656.1 Exostosin family protein [Tripterygium wilfordii]
MNFRKQLISTAFFSIPWTLNLKKNPKIKETHFKSYTPLFLLASLSVLSIFLFCCFSPKNNDVHRQTPKPTILLVPTCRSRVSLYVYDLPEEFNVGLLKDCRHLNVYTDMCPHVANSGLGQPLQDMDDGSTTGSWFATNQFMAEMLFHARALNHPCRTRDPARANLFYVPFYGGLHMSSKVREPNHALRDDLAVRLVDYLQSQTWWHRNHGRDHFITLGRTAWDFRRGEGGPDFGANSLINLPTVQNMSVLTVERQPWQGHNQYGIPYPSYFHPMTSLAVLTWQEKVGHSHRPHLFSFIGGPRKGVEKAAAIRDELINQCSQSRKCKLLKCDNEGRNDCHDPKRVLDIMVESEFCLQAPGDSFTRRSTFDAVLAGCVPVFFSPHTAYTQYKWYFPEEYGEYSVFIDVEKGNVSVEVELMKIGKERVEEMRKRVIDLIPRVSYLHSNASDVGFEDAVDVALEGLSNATALLS